MRSFLKKILTGLTVVMILTTAVLAADVNLPPVIQKAIESRVLVRVYLLNEEKTLFSAGSGVVVKPGYVITASHLFFVESLPISPENLLIEVSKNPSADPTKAQLLKIDPKNDLVLLKIEEPAKLGPAVKIAEIFPSDGEEVYISGFWGGFFNTTLKVVVLGKGNFKYDSFSVNDLAIIDRTIPPGFSGGPVFNSKGELIGMNLMTVPTAGFGGILPIYPIQFILKNIK